MRAFLRANAALLRLDTTPPRGISTHHLDPDEAHLRRSRVLSRQRFSRSHAALALRASFKQSLIKLFPLVKHGLQTEALLDVLSSSLTHRLTLFNRYPHHPG